MKKFACALALMFSVGFMSVAVTGCPATPTNEPAAEAAVETATEMAAEMAAETATETTDDGGTGE